MSVDLAFPSYEAVRTAPRLFSVKNIVARTKKLMNATIVGGSLLFINGSMARFDKEAFDQQVAHKQAEAALAKRFDNELPFDAPEMEDIDMLRAEKPIRIGETTFRLHNQNYFCGPDSPVLQVGKNRFFVETGLRINPLACVDKVKKSSDKILVTIRGNTYAFPASKLDALVGMLSSPNANSVSHEIEAINVEDSQDVQKIGGTFQNCENIGEVR